MGAPEDDCRVESGRRYRWTDVSVLILSLLLAASVATVVYMAVRPPATTCSNASVSQPQTAVKSTEVDVEVEVDGKKTPEKMAYNEGRNILLIHDADGGFSAEDFDKGWVVTDLAKSGECVVIPTGNSQNRTSVNSIMSGYANSGVIHGTKEGQSNVYAQILPGYVDDRSMFPDEVNKMCSRGYRWLTTVDLEDDSTFQTGERRKRALRGCYCSIFVQYSFTNSIFQYVTRRYEICIPWCFDNDCSVRSQCQRYPGTTFLDNSG